MHEVAGSSPVESTKTPRFGIAVSGCFLLRFFGRARGWEPLCASKAFSPRYTLFTLSSGENKRLIIVWRGAPLQARALSNPPKHPASALPFRGVFLLRFSISFMPYKKRRTKSIRCLFVRRYILFIVPKTAFILRRRLRRRVLRRRSRRNVRRCRLRRGTCRRLWVSGGTSPIRTTIAAWN